MFFLDFPIEENFPGIAVLNKVDEGAKASFEIKSILQINQGIQNAPFSALSSGAKRN
jgi:hypothetical protein